MDIEHVLKDGNCNQCGICVGVCPTNAIEIYQDERKGQFPRFDRSKCTDCDLCYYACPGEDVNWFNIKNFSIDEKTARSTYGDVGNYENIYSSYSIDEEVRQRGASGGVVSNLLIYLLEKGEIDGAVVVRMSSENPFEPDVFIAKSREEIIQSQQSKYLPVPVGAILKKIKKTKGRFAVVALPCHVQGIRQAQQKMPKVRDRIVLLIGLFCGFNPSFTSTKFLVKRAGVNNFDEVKEIRYRDDTWPGGFNVIKKDGTNCMIHPVQDFFWAHKVFEHHRCMTCVDYFNEFADISTGDEWRGDEHDREDYKKGWSFIVTRTSTGVELIRKLIADNVLYVEKTSPEIVVDGNMPKKEFAWASIFVRKFLGMSIPNYHYLYQRKEIRLKIYVSAIMVMIVSNTLEIKLINKLLVKAPKFVFMKYQNLIYKLFFDYQKRINN